MRECPECGRTFDHDPSECWDCGGLHDSLGYLCPNCDESGCQHFGGECQSDHNPVVPDGGNAANGTDRCDTCGQNEPLPALSECKECVNDGLPDGFELPERTRERAERSLGTGTEQEEN